MIISGRLEWGFKPQIYRFCCQILYLLTFLKLRHLLYQPGRRRSWVEILEDSNLIIVKIATKCSHSWVEGKFLGKSTRGFKPQTSQYRYPMLYQLSWSKMWVDLCNKLHVKDVKDVKWYFWSTFIRIQTSDLLMLLLVTLRAYRCKVMHNKINQLCHWP